MVDSEFAELFPHADPPPKGGGPIRPDDTDILIALLLMILHGKDFSVAELRDSSLGLTNFYRAANGLATRVGKLAELYRGTDRSIRACCENGRIVVRKLGESVVAQNLHQFGHASLDQLAAAIGELPSGRA